MPLVYVFAASKVEAQPVLVLAARNGTPGQGSTSLIIEQGDGRFAVVITGMGTRNAEAKADAALGLAAPGAVASPPLAERPDAELSGRSDLRCYFWPHTPSFLKEGGCYGFLTSSPWLDTEYGSHLQEWFLWHFAILALFESNCEPWFAGAGVTTVATLMRRESDPAKWAANTVRFVQLPKPLREVVTALSETIRLMAEIDAAIPKWPIE